MSDRQKQEQARLWWVRRVDGSNTHLFVGSVQEMAAYMSRLHLEDGVQYIAREVEK